MRRNLVASLSLILLLCAAPAFLKVENGGGKRNHQTQAVHHQAASTSHLIKKTIDQANLGKSHPGDGTAVAGKEKEAKHGEMKKSLAGQEKKALPSKNTKQEVKNKEKHIGQQGRVARKNRSGKVNSKYSQLKLYLFCFVFLSTVEKHNN